LAVLQGFFEPGEKLDQDLIAEEFGVSRTPVREALKVLESEGFIEIRPHRGAFIPVISRQDIKDVYEVRSLLEAEAVRLATPLIADSVLNELEQSLLSGRAQLDSGETDQHYDDDTFFHNTIFRYVQNRVMKEVLDSLENRIVRVRRFALMQPGSHLQKSIKEHFAILEAMRHRDPAAAAAAMKAHLTQSSLRIQELIKQDQA
jgi:DNA-binding GntR family transcriptional regulator